MGFMGLPSDEDLKHALGVLPEDRARWEQLEAAQQAHNEKKAAGRLGLGNKAVAPGLGLAQQAMQARLQAANTEANRTRNDNRPMETETITKVERSQRRFTDGGPAF